MNKLPKLCQFQTSLHVLRLGGTGSTRYVSKVCCQSINKNRILEINVSCRSLRMCAWTLQVRSYAQTKPEKEAGTGKELDIQRQNPYAGLSAGQKVKEASKDFTYLIICVAAVAALGAMFYAVGSELFSGDSVNGVYSKALKRCKNDTEVSVALGPPIKGYGEETRRGRRRHVSHQEFLVGGRLHMRMKFYVQGTDRKGDVNLEVVKDDNGHYSYRYLFVQLEEFPYRTIILEDNR